MTRSHSSKGPWGSEEAEQSRGKPRGMDPAEPTSPTRTPPPSALVSHLSLRRTKRASRRATPRWVPASARPDAGFCGSNRSRNNQMESELSLLSPEEDSWPKSTASPDSTTNHTAEPLNSSLSDLIPKKPLPDGDEETRPELVPRSTSLSRCPSSLRYQFEPERCASVSPVELQVRRSLSSVSEGSDPSGLHLNSYSSQMGALEQSSRTITLDQNPAILLHALRRAICLSSEVCPDLDRGEDIRNPSNPDLALLGHADSGCEETPQASEFPFPQTDSDATVEPSPCMSIFHLSPIPIRRRFSSAAMERGTTTSSDQGSIRPSVTSVSPPDPQTAKDEESFITTRSLGSASSDDDLTEQSSTTSSANSPPASDAAARSKGKNEPVPERLLFPISPSPEKESPDLAITLSLSPVSTQPTSPDTDSGVEELFHDAYEYDHPDLDERSWPSGMDMVPSGLTVPVEVCPLFGSLTMPLEVSPDQHGGPAAVVPPPIQPTQTQPALQAADQPVNMPQEAPESPLVGPVAKPSHSLPVTPAAPAESRPMLVRSATPPPRPSTPTPDSQPVHRTPCPSPSSTSSRSSRKSRRQGIVSWFNGLKVELDSGTESMVKPLGKMDKKRAKPKREASVPWDNTNTEPTSLPWTASASDEEKQAAPSGLTGFFGNLFGKRRASHDSPLLWTPVGRRLGTTSDVPGAVWGGAWAGMDDRDDFTRFPMHVERAIYRLSHFKLANPRRIMRDQVLISCFMQRYLSIVQATGEAQVVYPPGYRYAQVQHAMHAHPPAVPVHVNVQEHRSYAPTGQNTSCPTYHPIHREAPWPTSGMGVQEIAPDQLCAVQHQVAMSRHRLSSSPSPPPPPQVDYSSGYHPVGYEASHAGPTVFDDGIDASTHSRQVYLPGVLLPVHKLAT